MSLYHGSRTAELKPGDIIEPRYTKGYKNNPVAFASRMLYTARVFGKKGATYEVEPIDHSDIWDQRMPYDNDEGHMEVLSYTGFRVVRLVPDDEYDPWDIIGNYLKESGYESVEAWAEDSDFYCEDNEWFNEDGDPVNINIEILGAIEGE